MAFFSDEALTPPYARTANDRGPTCHNFKMVPARVPTITSVIVGNERLPDQGRNVPSWELAVPLR
ncbi:MAG: hypothetical protein A3I00_00740 [Betaproteobacteria bacterium RIFCSPLOWO2_02_FULL_64_12]|nr:MAG: hypothetical protein A3I00_00740 [Betaproteobacteria bacterium RIFCSPLOWO2_02_FULL_64_12]